MLLGLGLVSLLLWQRRLTAQQERVAERVDYQAHNLARRLEANLHDQVAGLRRIALQWDYRGRIPMDEWLLDSRFSLERVKGYQAIQWLGADLAMRWIEPLQGNEAAQQFRLTPAHQNRDILHMNQATYSSLGYSAEVFRKRLKQDPEHLLPGDHDWLEGVRQAQHDKLTSIFQQKMRRRDGSEQAAEISVQLVRINDHEYLTGVTRDNSQRLQLEAQLQRLSQQDGLTGLYNRRFSTMNLTASGAACAARAPR